VINPSLLKVRTGNDESKIAVPVLEARLGVQGNLPAAIDMLLQEWLHRRINTIIAVCSSNGIVTVMTLFWLLV